MDNFPFSVKKDPWFLLILTDNIGMSILYGKPEPDLIVSRKHRISFIHVEYARVMREANSVIARGAYDIDLPIATTNALLLGTGTSITTEAIAEIARWGCNTTFVAGGGLGLHTFLGSGSSNSARLAIRQAEIASNPQLRIEAARRMYHLRWGESHVPPDMTIRQLMQFEGRRIKALYREEAKKSGVKFARRHQKVDFEGEEDLINQLLTAGNHVTYGLCAAVIASLGLSPSLGIVHHGHGNSFVFDIADLYKESMVIPLAFLIASQGGSPEDFRANLRANSKGLNLMPKIIDDIYYCLDLKDAPKGDATDSNESFLWDEDGVVLNRGINIEGVA